VVLNDALKRFFDALMRFFMLNNALMRFLVLNDTWTRYFCLNDLARMVQDLNRTRQKDQWTKQNWMEWFNDWMISILNGTHVSRIEWYETSRRQEKRKG
jgi:hypothetical protein